MSINLLLLFNNNKLKNEYNLLESILVKLDKIQIYNTHHLLVH